ncbi:protein-disulfide reductase DsbD, partial [bacterium]
MEAKAPAEPASGFWELIHESNPERLLDQGKITLLGLALFGGILTSFTPCVLPIVPLTLAFIGVKHRRRGNFLRAVALVLG